MPREVSTIAESLDSFAAGFARNASSAGRTKVGMAGDGVNEEASSALVLAVGVFAVLCTFVGGAMVVFSSFSALRFMMF